MLTLIFNKTDSAGRAQGVSLYANAFDLGISAGSMALGAVAAFSFSSLWMLVAGVTFVGFLVALLGQVHRVQLG
jgi:predicted MFS family arabinose efflux permease